MKCGNIDIQVGGFHDHWLRNGTDTSSVLIAAVTKYHYDFICLMDHEFGSDALKIKEQLENWIPGFRAYIGEERAYGWGHIVSVMNDCPNVDLQNEDFFEEMKKMKECGGIVALAHIGYPSSYEKIVRAGHIDRLIEEEYVDAIQIEKDADWEFIKERAELGKKLPLISGWDSHMLTPFFGMPDCLYDETFGVKEHFENPSLVRTIVFAEDNSLESIQEALNRGESVMEDMESGRIYGSPRLVKLLEENGYREKMHELDDKYNARNIKSSALCAGENRTIHFPTKGRVFVAKNPKLEYDISETDDCGAFEYADIPMPVEQDESYLPIMFDDGEFKRYWAVKVENDINIDVTIDLKNGKRILRLVANKPFSGTIAFSKPHKRTYIVSAEKGEVLCETEIGEKVEQIFEYEFLANAENGRTRRYSKRAALAYVKKTTDWEDADEIAVEDAVFCGGFGSFREYPGKDVFSFRVKMRWDEKYFYVRYDITDKIYVPPVPGEFMYLYDVTFLTLDVLFARTNNSDASGGATIGFPDEKGKIYIANPKYPDGTHYFKRDKNFVSKSKLKMETTEYGRIVTAQIPWEELSPKTVKAGDRMGLLVSAVNNEGKGLVDNMQWPWPAKDGKWLFPSNWGTLILVE